MRLARALLRQVLEAFNVKALECGRGTAGKPRRRGAKLFVFDRERRLLVGRGGGAMSKRACPEDSDRFQVSTAALCGACVVTFSQ